MVSKCFKLSPFTSSVSSGVPNVLRFRSLANTLACLCLAVIFTGCGSSSDPSSSTAPAGGGSKDSLRIAVIPKGTSHEFWKSVHFGAKQAAQEIGNVEIIWRGPVVESDTGSQIEVVKSMITLQVDGVALAPNQKGGLVDVVEMAEAIGAKGNVILLRYLAGSESTEQREQGFLDKIAEYTDITVVSSDQRGGENATKAKEKVDQLLQIHGENLAGIFAVCEPNANGALEALRNAGVNNKVKLIAFDPSDALIEGLGDGSCSGIVLQDPVEMGYQAVMTLAGAIKGEQAESFISTGESVATPDNMNDEEIQGLLKPEIIE
jgi:ribose transport system substrate-binding protein